MRFEDPPLAAYEKALIAQRKAEWLRLVALMVAIGISNAKTLQRKLKRDEN